MDSNTLELVRKTLFGGSAGGVLDFNAAFSSVPMVAGGNFNDLMAALTGDKGNSNGPNDAIGNAPTSSLSNIDAAIGVIGQAMMGFTSPVPGVVSAINGITGMQGMISQAINAMNGLANPEGISTNNSGLTPQAMEAIAESGGDSADGDSGGSSAGGTGTSAGNSGDADGGNGSPDAGADGSYFQGGFVPGPPTGQDKVNINVDGGEVVIPAHIVDMLGRNFFEDLLLNTKSPAVEFLEKQQKEAEAKAKKSQGNK